MIIGNSNNIPKSDDVRTICDKNMPISHIFCIPTLVLISARTIRAKYIIANPYAKPNKNKVSETGTNDKNTLLSFLLKAGFRNE